MLITAWTVTTECNIFNKLFLLKLITNWSGTILKYTWRKTQISHDFGYSQCPKLHIIKYISVGKYKKNTCSNMNWSGSSGLSKTSFSVMSWNSTNVTVSEKIQNNHSCLGWLSQSSFCCNTSVVLLNKLK